MLSPARSRQWAMRLGSKLFRRTGCGATLIYTHRPLPSLVRGAFSTGTTRATRQEKEEKTMEQPNDAHQSRTASGRTTLETLHFDNRALRVLPIDPLNENFPRKVPNACFSRVMPTPVQAPFTVAVSLPALGLIDIDLEETKRADFASYFSGNKVLSGAEPAAHCYCGHQFGYFSGQLGDGATMYLGEVINSKGERWEIQFKGAGKTPYSRTADGRKVLRSSLREFLCSEAMHHLGIPTTRAGTVVSSETHVTRDIFYNGNPKRERATIILRIAPSFLRFGSFEVFKPRDPVTQREGPSPHNVKLLLKLLDYSIETFYPDIWQSHTDPEARYIQFYQEVVRRTARLVAEWQAVGFCHGVLNTDNMSILGLTIDYGPFGFLDFYDPNFICNGSDDGGRYSYKNQPEICHWNCKKLAEALALAVPLDELESQLDKTYWPEFNQHYNEKMRKKLGLLLKEEEGDEQLVQSFFEAMHESGADFTNSFRCLSRVVVPSPSETIEEKNEDEDEVLHYLLQQVCSAELMTKRDAPTIPAETLKMMVAVAQQNPMMLQMFGMTPEKLLNELKKLEKQEGKSASGTVNTKKENDIKVWKTWLKKYRVRLQREFSDVSEGQREETNQKRIKVMNQNNPRFILRNYLAQKAVEQAENGNFTEAERLLSRVLSSPYNDQGHLIPPMDKRISHSSCSDKELSELGYDAIPPQWAAELCVT